MFQVPGDPNSNTAKLQGPMQAATVLLRVRSASPADVRVPTVSRKI